jgi:DNA-binding CsgD family transcriptional regulator/tetratricopeptide (TPR) repeat protein
MSVAPGIIEAVSLNPASLRPIVGRDQDLDRLLTGAGITPAHESEALGGLVVLSGDAGMGKTRLLAELAERAGGLGWRVVVGHCLGEAGSELPYLPFVELLGRLFSDEPEVADELIVTHPSLGPLLQAHLRGPAGQPSESHRGDLFESLHAGLEYLAAGQPLLVLIEDVHWADQSSRELLSLLLTRGFLGPVSLVISFRGDDLHRRHPLRATVANWSRLAQVRRIDLGPLDRVSMRQLVRGLDADGPGASGLAEREVDDVVERAEGNAFFAEEIAAASMWGQAGVGADLSRLLLVRFEQLDGAGQTVVRLASAAGRNVSHELLARVVQEAAAIEQTALDAALRDAVERHILVPTETGYAFRHALLAETVYDDMLPGERVRAHATYARVIDADSSLGKSADLARHAAEAGERALALRASVSAGGDAMSMGGPDEALRHYERALGLGPDEPEEATAIAGLAAAAAMAAGHPTRAVALLRERLDRPGLPDRSRAELLAELAQAARATELDVDALALTEEALGLVPTEDETKLRARVLAAHAQALADRMRNEEAVKFSRKATELADRLGLPEITAEVETFVAKISERSGDVISSQETLERVIAETSSGLTRIRAMHHLGSLHHRAGRLKEALDVYQHGMDKARRIGRAWAPYGFDCRVLAAIAAYEYGDWDRSLQLTDFSGESPPPGAEAMLRAVELMVRASRGERERVAEAEGLRDAWALDGLIAISATTALVEFHGDAGDIDRADSALRDAVEFLRDLWQLKTVQTELRLNTVMLAHLSRRATSVSAAERRRLRERGEAYAQRSELVWEDDIARGATGLEAQAWRTRGHAELLRLRWVTGDASVDLDDLVGAWRSSVDSFEDYGHRFETARSQARLAAVLDAAGDPGAASFRDAALTTARELGARPLIAELGFGTAPAASSTPAAATLTRREREILSLVDRGLSNREIGERLFISAKTVSVHVSNIIGKLDASGRGEAAAIARDRGLL